VRYLLIDANYPEFLDSVYRDHPNLAAATYAEQQAAIHAGLFGEAPFQADALRALGHEADVIVTNAHVAQRAWAREQGATGLARRPWDVRLRRGFVPWPTRTSTETNWKVLFAQVRDYRPDVIYVGIMDTMPAGVAAQLKTMTRLLVAQVATALPADLSYRDYDLVVSSIPAQVDSFRAEGSDAEWVPLAFEPSVLDKIPLVHRDVPVSFVGSFTNRYSDRLGIVEAVARVAPLRTWTWNVDLVPADSPIRSTVQGAAWGRDMYQVLARSLMTLNTHGRISGEDANNLRLYEATGMGTLLVTDARRNMSQLFDVGSEVVTYRDAEECARMVRYYLDHPAEAASIAAAGQRRTLRDHTWANRMARIAELVGLRLRRP
jgi:hypothetical protein